MGHLSDAKILVVQADDLGMTHSANKASIKAIQSGLVNSVGIMPPCPWFPEIAGFLRENPSVDFGLHLTLTSEWPLYRWGPLCCKKTTPSLVDPQGYFYRTSIEAAQNINPKEAEIELQAQIEHAYSFGLSPTYLDSHMFLLYQTPALFEAFMRIGKINGIPTLILKDVFNWMKLPVSLIMPDNVLVYNTIRIRSNMSIDPCSWFDYYADLLDRVPPGITEIILHLSYDDEEMQSATAGIGNFGANWRHRDLSFLLSDRFSECVERNHIITRSWGSIFREFVKT